MKRAIAIAVTLVLVIVLSSVIYLRANQPQKNVEPPLADQTGITLPPDPGESGKQTLAGIDSDHDGVRDDIERWILQRYKDTSLIAALRTYALAEQGLIVAVNNESEALRLAAVRRQVFACWEFLAPQDNSKALLELEAIFLNTPARLKSYDNSDRFLGGHTFLLITPSASACKAMQG